MQYLLKRVSYIALQHVLVFHPTGSPESIPPPLNYTHFATKDKIDFSYHTIVLPGNESGLHVEIIPKNPNNKLQV